MPRAMWPTTDRRILLCLTIEMNMVTARVGGCVGDVDPALRMMMETVRELMLMWLGLIMRLTAARLPALLAI